MNLNPSFLRQFILLVALMLTGCNEKRLELITNKEAVLSEKELNKQGKYTVNEVLSNEVYHQSDDADRDINTKCTYDYYRPKELNGKKLPVIIFLHEGGFVFGDRTNFVATKICKDLARAGFAVANLNYRLINNPRALVSKEATHRYIMEAVAQVRLGVQHLQQEANSLFIDESKIYIMGWSAGAAIANSIVFTDKEEAMNYVSSGHTNNFNHSDAFDIPLNIKGVISIGGCLMADDVDDTDLTTTKCLLIHGTNDDMMPIGFDYPLKRYREGINVDLPTISPSIHIGGKAITLGLNIHTPDWLHAGVMNLATSKVYGSKAIFDLAQTPNMSMIEVKGGKHDFFLTNNNFNENYSTIITKIRKFIQ